jgi:hypothetical protein
MGKTAVFLLVGALLLGVWLLVILSRRRIFRIFPFFFAYVVSSVIIEIVKLAVIADYPIYFRVFWSAEILYAILTLLALREAFRHLFGAFFRIYSWFWLVFPIATAVTAAVPVLHALAHPPIQASPVISLILSVEMGVYVLQSGLFMIFLMIRRLLKMRHRTYSWGIVEGFAAIALAGLTYAARSEFGTKFGFLAEYGTSVAYILAVGLWLDTFIRAPKWEGQWASGITPRQLSEELRMYTRFLKRPLDRRK